MQKRILIIEDEEAINDLLVLNLQTVGYETTSFYDGLKASIHLGQENNYDLAILDIMLPGKDGFALLPELNAAKIPVVCLTAKGDIVSKVKGLRDGAEDYIVKPFETLELLIRIEKILKRYGKEVDEISIGDIHIFIKERKVKRGSEEIHLKPMEFDCLLLLAKNKNIALTREEILNNLWGVEFEGETRTIDVHIGRIRKKLGWQEVIKTIPRIGYRLEIEV